MYPHSEIKFSATICSCFERKPLGEYVTQPSVKKLTPTWKTFLLALLAFLIREVTSKAKKFKLPLSSFPVLVDNLSILTINVENIFASAVDF